MRASRKGYRIKKKKSILKNRLFWLASLTIFFLSSFSWLFIFSPVFRINEVLVSGNEKITAQEIKNLVLPRIEKKFLGIVIENIFLTDSKIIKSLVLERFPLIDELKVKKLLPDYLSIEITERKAIGLWCRDNACFSFDKKGIIFKSSQKESSENLIIDSKQSKGEDTLGKKVIEEKRLSQILLIQKTIKEKAKIEVKEFTFFENEARLNAITTEGWQVYFDLNSDLNWQLVELELVLEKELPQEKRQNLEYIELRFNKVYYK
jgi:cell division septal protein FtsQ